MGYYSFFFLGVCVVGQLSEFSFCHALCVHACPNTVFARFVVVSRLSN